MHSSLGPADVNQLNERDIAAAEGERQLELLRGERRYLQLVRPAVLGDGIQPLDQASSGRMSALHGEAAGRGRWLKFVPASGAASRMFALKDDGEREELCARLPEFAFHDSLSQACAVSGETLESLLERGATDVILDRLLSDAGLGYAALPKGLLEFHRYGNVSRTPFEEHLREAARDGRAADGACTAHFTVSPEHRPLFEQLLSRLRKPLGEAANVRFDVTFSLQKPSTDTLAVDDHGEPLRDESGRLILRPGGHGALIDNLNDLRADLVFVKNIDNVQHEDHQAATHSWIRILGGWLLELQRQLHEHLRELDEDPAEATVAAAESFVAEQFPGLAAALRQPHVSRLDHVRHLLHRPVRVCGMVRNEGEPGGGPFWVREEDGSTSLQIVESAEVDPNDEAQLEILRHATHFNPVFMALGLRDHRDEPYDLQKYVHPGRVILTRKVSQGRHVRVLERPGLWNGAMADWNTVFVEVPKEVFAPVKTVLDLLREAHQPGDAG